MNKVYILQEMGNHDYSGVEEYGEPLFVGRRDINSRFPIMGTPGNRAVVMNLFNKLYNFTDDDFIVISGNPIMVALALHYLVSIRKVRVRILKWNNREFKYTPLDYPGIVFDNSELFRRKQNR